MHAATYPNPPREVTTHTRSLLTILEALLRENMRHLGRLLDLFCVVGAPLFLYIASVAFPPLVSTPELHGCTSLHAIVHSMAALVLKRADQACALRHTCALGPMRFGYIC